jgi:hypothetical protein
LFRSENVKDLLFETFSCAIAQNLRIGSLDFSRDDQFWGNSKTFPIDFFAKTKFSLISINVLRLIKILRIMKFIKFILPSIIIFIIFSCNNRTSKKIDSISLYPKKTIETINDTTFFSTVFSMKYSNGNLFISDFKNNRVLCTNREYKLLRIFGQTGNGPGDLINPFGCFIDSQYLYVFQHGNERINKYDINNNKFVGDIPFKIGMLDHGYLILKDSIYSSFMKDEFPISIMDMSGVKIKSFGSRNHVLKLNQGFPRVFMFEYLKKTNEILAICESEPVIEKYSKDGKLIKVYNFSNYEPFHESIIADDQLRKEPRDANATFGFIQDTFIDDDYLYLLIYSYNKEKKCDSSNTIMILRMTQNDIIPIKNLILNPNEDSWFTAFTIYSNKLIAYNSVNSEINEYDLPN